MDTNFDLEAKPLARALISSAVKSMDIIAAPDAAQASMTHLALLQLGITQVAQDISDNALLLLGRPGITSSSDLPGDAPVIIGFSLFVMLGIIQAVRNEGIPVDARELTANLIERHLDQKINTKGNDQTAHKDLLAVSRIASQIPGQIVETAKGEVEALFSRCYSVIPGYVLGNDETRAPIMPIFGTALHVLLQSQVKPDH